MTFCEKCKSWWNGTGTHSARWSKGPCGHFIIVDCANDQARPCDHCDPEEDFRCERCGLHTRVRRSALGDLEAQHLFC